MIFWYDGYEFEAGTDEIMEACGVCYVNHPDSGWVKLEVDPHESGPCKWRDAEGVDEPPADGLRAKFIP